MRKRRHERSVSTVGPRLFMLATVLLILFIAFASSGIGGAYAYYRAQMPLLNGIAQHSLFQTTHIYDRNGKLLYDLYDHNRIDRGRRTYVDYKDISPLLVNATIAAEDHTFWTNDGVDYSGIARAAVSNVENQGVVEGGSTITQQLIKKQFFDGQRRTIQIKGEEAILATGLTRQYSKQKIMEMYLNTVFYGDSNYGVEAAAQDYFGLKPQCSKDHCTPAVAQLDLAQASLLAGLPQSPTGYTPTVYKDHALKRQRQVLQWMVDLGYITDQERLDAQKEMENYDFTSHSGDQQKLAPGFVDYVTDQLIHLLGAQNLYDGGYSVYTSIDLDLQQKVESLVHDHLYKAQADNYLGYYPALNIYHNVNNGAAVVMDPTTGEILAMDGSADYFNTSPEVSGQVNVATSTDRQTGSSFKPIVYATAFEMGWYPAMIVPDHQTFFPEPTDGKPYYAPNNYDRQFHTSFPMTIRQAVGNSYNIPAADTLNFVGPNILNMASRLGITELSHLQPGDVTSSMALGTKPVSLLNMTAAYGTFANKGVHMPTTSILSITDNTNKTIYTYNAGSIKGTRAVREDVSYLISSILSDKLARYHEFFRGNPLELDRPAAAKTGTTEDYKDNWTIGYTPHLAVGVWAGNSNGELMRDVIGITGAGPIWHDIMEYASQRYNYPPDDFVRPDNVHQGTVSAFTGLLPHPGEPTVTDWFIDGTMPTIQGAYTPPPPPSSSSNCQSNNNNNNNNNNGGSNCTQNAQSQSTSSQGQATPTAPDNPGDQATSTTNMP
ncbi:hypothetical protein KTT_07310 [Tengunoibacter tsumagoiensis]|uniref:Uncharacterized protein n=2 Tax=Tengunoibacter tsumagoiensis TaxID=2014871 RepID=A0A401ZVQ6_9CHLR|nr:hypothetical protein KTT_07310 [Tengunoibacter tsumagoiensis]